MGATMIRFIKQRHTKKRNIVLFLGFFVLFLLLFFFPGKNKEYDPIIAVLEENQSYLKEQKKETKAETKKKSETIETTETTESEKKEKETNSFFCNIIYSILKTTIPIWNTTEDYGSVFRMGQDNSIWDNLYYDLMSKVHPVESYMWKEEAIEALAYQENISQLEGISEEQEYSKEVQENKKEQVQDNIPIEGSVEVITGETYYEELTRKEEGEGVEENKQKIKQLKDSLDTSYLLDNFYIINSSTTTVDKSIFNVKTLLEKDMTLKKSKSKPQILIFHTHGASEAFIDSREGKQEDSIIGVGGHLADILAKEYQFHVIHDETPYDKMGGSIDRNLAYNAAAKVIPTILEKYPSIEVVIDLHRDGISDDAAKRVTTINGKKTAQVMFFNGISRNLQGDIDYLYNPNLQNNLSFSLQMELAAMEKYPNFAKKIFIKGYRYNMHLKPRYLLIELGANNNTVEEAYNAMEPLAEILNDVLTGSTG